MATVVLPYALTRLFPGAPRKHETGVETLGEVIAELDGCWPGMRDRLCENSGRLRRHLEVFVDGEKSTLETPLGPSSEVVILLAVSGG